MLRVARLAGVFVCAGLLLVGCGTSIPVGALYTDVKVPVSGNGGHHSKRGEASCTSILSLIAMGDCSVETAAKAGGISNIKSVDRKVTNILGIYGRYTTIVKGD
ncbi:TRL-like family protein [Helicobacter labacensis]|uniref:TRL-like family protein n=1 Tax=Helicobacter labacensis TaxID=2316079 RepID=UPI000EB420C0|nr:TRL-like family protein [Helicobacter labacensis]